MTQIYVVHGYTASPEENWFPWIQQQADQAGVALKVLRLDPSPTPILSTWDQQMAEQIGRLGPETIVIAHSLGCLASLHFLSHQLKDTGIQIAQLILVAGFNRRLGRLEEVNPFIDAAQIDFDLIQQQVKSRIVIYSKGDDRVAPHFSLEQAKSLDAEVIETQHQGHFIDSQGCRELPEVWQSLHAHIQQKST